MIHKLQVTVLILLIPFGALYLYTQSQNISISEIFSNNTPLIHVGEMPMTVEIVDTDETRTIGLSGREKMKTAGMLFVFDDIDYHGMWMKDMLFSIDIIWVDETLTVVGIEQNVNPNTYPKTFRPPVPVKYAIETDAQYTETFGITVGDRVRLPITYEKNKK